MSRKTIYAIVMFDDGGLGIDNEGLLVLREALSPEEKAKLDLRIGRILAQHAGSWLVEAEKVLAH